MPSTASVSRSHGHARASSERADRYTRTTLANLAIRRLELYVPARTERIPTEEGEMLKADHVDDYGRIIQVFVRAADVSSLPGTFVVGRALIREKREKGKPRILYVVFDVVPEAEADGDLKILPNDLPMSDEQAKLINTKYLAGKLGVYVFNRP